MKCIKIHKTAYIFFSICGLILLLPMYLILKLIIRLYRFFVNDALESISRNLRF